MQPIHPSPLSTKRGNRQVLMKIDFIASGMSITPELKAAVNFREPYWVVRQLLAQLAREKNLILLPIHIP